jgi:hypothetical protein
VDAERGPTSYRERSAVHDFGPAGTTATLRVTVLRVLPEPADTAAAGDTKTIRVVMKAEFDAITTESKLP